MNAQDQATSDLLALCTDVMNAMRSYAEKYNVDIEDTTTEVECETNHPQIIVTVPKFITQDHRDNLEQSAFEAASQSPLKPFVKFVYEQSAG
jgi:hypothetical protein